MNHSDIDHPIPVRDILPWTDYFDTNKDELVKVTPSASEEVKKNLAVDWDINSRVSLYEGNIITLQIDGIVSPNNELLQTTGGCSYVVELAAGEELKKQLTKCGGCKTGKAVTTPGFNLPAKYIIHVVGPRGRNPGILAKSYDSCLTQMEKYQMKSVAFACISTGNFDYPSEEAACVALKRVRRYLDELKKKNKLEEKIDRIVFCLFAQEDISAYKRWMQIFFPCGSDEEYTEWMKETKAKTLESLDGYIKITTTEPDMITYDDCPDRRRAIMPCRHVIGPDSMTDYCKDILDKGNYIFPCPDPSCNVEWQYFQVRHVACLTRRQMQEFEKRISENYIRKEGGTQKCPQCHIICCRKDKTHNCVQCTFCSKKNGKNYYFCWKCLGEWKGGAGNICGSTRCHGIDERIAILAQCPMKRILDRFDSPSVRGCPKCGLLIEYLCWCTQMHCKGCGHYFCFLCLTGAKTKAELTCDPYKSTCTIAPRQTTLPGM